MSIIGHSAGADATILAANKAVENGLRNLKRVVLLDPTLTSSAGNGFPDYSNQSDPTFGTDDDLGPLVKNSLDHGTWVFVGLGKLYGARRDPLRTYLDPLTTNQAEFVTYQWRSYSYNYARYKHFSHPEMATKPDVTNDVLSFLN